ncbi:MAG TPA: EMC3/TMCO1 family protein [Nitrososphaerales archaeon]|nr:EMC3/TMCO1 family protein [Nitrososphaerales archaeon]
MQTKAKGKNKSSGSGAGLLIIIVLAVIVIYVLYYSVGPLFTPKPAAPHPTIALNPAANIVGSLVSISGQYLAPNRTVTAKFNSSPLALEGTCSTSSSGVLSGCIFVVPASATGSSNVTVDDGTNLASAKFSIPGTTVPESTFLVTLTSISLGLATQLVTRRVVDLNAERKMKAELSEFNKEKREATLAKDTAKLEKLKRRELAMRQEQSKVQLARLKVSGITIVPLFGVYYLMATFLGGYSVTVAHAPFVNLGLPILFGSDGSVSLFWWYFLSSFVFSTMLAKLLRTTP